MTTAHAKLVPMRWGPPIGETNKRPSVEQSGHGNQLCYDGIGGRWFRASEDWVQQGCQKLVEIYRDGANVNYSNLYEFWNITTSDFGYRYGWSSSEDERIDLSFDVDHCGPGTSLYEVFYEDVLLVTVAHGCEPLPGYMEP